MSDFLFLLQFMWIPIVVTLCLSVTLPVVGTVLSIRNELMVAVALPMLSGAVLAILAALGMPEHLLALRVVITILAVVTIYWVVMKSITSQAIRQTTLAGLWIGSEAVTRLLVTIHPEIEGEFSQLLNGEMLAVGIGEMITISVISILFVGFIILKFSQMRMYMLDEIGLKRFPKQFVQSDMGMKLFTTIFVVLGTVTVGPLVTTSLMIIPPLTADNRRGGLTNAMVWSILIGVISVAVAFPVSLIKDLPPAYTISVGVVVVGALKKCVDLIHRR